MERQQFLNSLKTSSYLLCLFSQISTKNWTFLILKLSKLVMNFLLEKLYRILLENVMNTAKKIISLYSNLKYNKDYNSI